ncbi:hypothetical protein NKG94_26570 [Micromonospora sp. M12]
MPEALLWAVAILLAVAAGWAWNSWRHRAANRRPGTRPGRGGTGGRRPTAPRPRAPIARPPAALARHRTRGRQPAPGEIWWADVPYADGSGSKVRPCLVLRADSRAPTS